MFGDRSLIPAAGEAPAGVEVVSERTATSRTFETEIPGVFVTESSLARINYREGGEWHEIDPTLTSDGGGGFENAADSTTISVAGDAAEETVASVELADGSSVGFGLDDAESSEAAVDGDTAVFEDVQPGVDLELQSTPSGLKETIVLGSPAAPDSFTFPLEVTGLAGAVDASGAVLFRDSAGVVRMTIPPGWMEDSSTDPDTGLPATSTGVTYALSSDGAALVVTLDRAWLDDPARVYPVRVDPTLEPTYAHIWSETDDTYVADTGSATDRSTQYVLKAGFDGTSVYRSFLHFDLTSLEGMNVIGADLALVQNGSGSCTATPLDVYEVTEEWAGDETMTWPGPDTAADPTTTITSGKGHDSTCPYGFAQADLTRTARNWIADSATNFGLSLRARDEASTAQFKQAGSRESYVPPTINVLWSDPTLESAPFDPVSLAPRNVTTTAAPEFSALYQDPEFDDGVVVFFGYVAATGAFSGAMVSDEVAAGADAVVTASSFPLDFAFEWRAMSVDLVNEVPSPLSEPVPLVRPSVRLVSPLADDTVSGIVTVNAQLDDSIGDATGVVFSLDATPVMADTAAPYRMVGPSNPLDDGDHVLTATISGGAADGRTSAPVTITIDNEPDTDPATEAAPNETRRPVLRRMRGATDEPANIDPINSHEADCGFSEDLPGNRTLWVFCDRLNSNGNGASSQVASPRSSTRVRRRPRSGPHRSFRSRT